MKYQIKNEILTVQIEDLGAQLASIKGSDGTEYLWQGDPKYWSDRALNIFPYVARLTEGKYTLDGKTYEMLIHGFAKDTIFQAEQKSDSHIIFSMENTEETYKQYPYAFRFEISYQLEGNKLLNTYSVKNKDDKQMYFGVGGHPGFNVPFEENTVFEDYYLEFDSVEEAKRVEFSEDCFVTGEIDAFALQDGKCLKLTHNLFDNDAIVLVDMSKGVTLKSDKGSKAIRVTYPNMQYLGFWHKPKTDAPYVCIEPWSSLPARKGIVEDFSTQPGLVSLEVDGEYENSFVIEVIE